MASRDDGAAVLLTDHEREKERDVIVRVGESRLFIDYRAAFFDVTGLPLELKSPEEDGAGTLLSPNRGFCGQTEGTSLACGTCLTLRERLEPGTCPAVRTVKCFAGMELSLVPVTVGSRAIAYLQTGPVLFRRPTEAGFRRATASIRPLVGADVVRGIRKAYFKSPVMPKLRYDAVIRLVGAFALQLSSTTNQVVTKESVTESVMITRARGFIESHIGEALSLTAVSSAVFTSPFYFCKKFKAETGLTFTEYVARTRVEQVKRAMMNPNKRVGEAAYEAGFQSLSQFNRVFRRIEGQSPTSYREGMAAPIPPPTLFRKPGRRGGMWIAA